VDKFKKRHESLVEAMQSSAVPISEMKPLFSDDEWMILVSALQGPYFFSANSVTRDPYGSNGYKDEEKTSDSINIDRIATDTPASSRNKLIEMKEIIQELEGQLGKVIPIEDLIKAAGERKIDDEETKDIIAKLKRAGDCYEPRRGYISRI